ncbi:MAG: hypothetical protein WAN65_03685 [Candidatus Sulfotelmatobacter sp.]
MLRALAFLAFRVIEAAFRWVGIAALAAAGFLVLTMLIARLARRELTNSKGDEHETHEG